MTEFRAAGLDLTLLHEIHRGVDEEVLDDLGYAHAETAEEVADHDRALSELSGRALRLAAAQEAAAVAYCGDHGIPLSQCACNAARYSVHQRGRRYGRRSA